MKEDFKENFKPLMVPAHYHKDDDLENKIIYVLGQLGEATAKEVGFELAKLENADEAHPLQQEAQKYLYNLYSNGLLKAKETEDGLQYNLSKIERPNGGKVNPDLLE